MCAIGVETGSYDDALPERGRRSPRHGRIPHAAFATVSPAREDAPKKVAGDQCAAQGRQVIHVIEPGASDGAAAWTAGAADRRRFARAAFAHDARHDVGPGTLRLPAGNK